MPTAHSAARISGYSTRLLASIGLLISILSTGCFSPRDVETGKDRNPPRADDSPKNKQADAKAHVSLAVCTEKWPNSLMITVSNDSQSSLRLWEDGNSWGWKAFSICMLQKDGEVIHVKRKPSDFTKNAPDFFDIAAGKSKVLSLDLDDEWWTLPENANWKTGTVDVSVILYIRESPESLKYSVWTGTSASPWVELAAGCGKGAK